MRYIFLIGGFSGFALVAVAGLTAGRTVDLVFRDAAIGCVAGALLFRWFWSVLLKALSETLVIRRAAARAAEDAAAAAKNQPVVVAAPTPVRSK